MPLLRFKLLHPDDDRPNVGTSSCPDCEFVPSGLHRSKVFERDGFADTTPDRLSLVEGE